MFDFLFMRFIEFLFQFQDHIRVQVIDLLVFVVKFFFQDLNLSMTIFKFPPKLLFHAILLEIIICPVCISVRVWRSLCASFCMGTHLMVFIIGHFQIQQQSQFNNYIKTSIKSMSSNRHSYYPFSRKLKTQNNIQQKPKRSEQLYGSIRRNIQMARMEISSQPNEEQQLRQDLSKKYGSIIIRPPEKHQIRMNSFSDKQSEIKQHQKLSRIIQSLRSNEKQLNRSESLKRSKVSKQVRGKQKYESMMMEYHRMMQQYGSKNETGITNFVEILSTMNNFLAKLDPLVFIPLFKVGNIRIVPEKKVLYSQNEQCHSFFIILWGEFKLKDMHSNKVKYCISGDSLREEVVINLKNVKNSKNVGLGQKIAQYRCLQTAKSLVISGVLEIKKEKYEKVRKHLAENGFNSKFNLVDKMLMWAYIKKQRLKKNQ